MTKEEYISYKKALFREEYEAKIRRLEKAVNHPQNYAFVYCDTDAAVFKMVRIKLFLEEVFQFLILSVLKRIILLVITIAILLVGN